MTEHDTPMITGPQITAARALTGVSQTKLSIRSGLDLAAIRRLEAKRAVHSEDNEALMAARRALEELGAMFIDESGGFGAGVRLKFSRTQARAIGAWEGEGGVPADDDVQ